VLLLEGVGEADAEADAESDGLAETETETETEAVGAAEMEATEAITATTVKPRLAKCIVGERTGEDE